MSWTFSSESRVTLAFPTAGQRFWLLVLHTSGLGLGPTGQGRWPCNGNYLCLKPKSTSQLCMCDRNQLLTVWQKTCTVPSASVKTLYRYHWWWQATNFPAPVTEWPNQTQASWPAGYGGWDRWMAMGTVYGDSTTCPSLPPITTG